MEMTDPSKQVAVRRDPGAVVGTAGEGGRKRKPVQRALEEEEFTEVGLIKNSKLNSGESYILVL